MQKNIMPLYSQSSAGNIHVEVSRDKLALSDLIPKDKILSQTPFQQEEQLILQNSAPQADSPLFFQEDRVGMEESIIEDDYSSFDYSDQGKSYHKKLLLPPPSHEEPFSLEGSPEIAQCDELIPQLQHSFSFKEAQCLKQALKWESQEGFQIQIKESFKLDTLNQNQVITVRSDYADKLSRKSDSNTYLDLKSIKFDVVSNRSSSNSNRPKQDQHQLEEIEKLNEETQKTEENQQKKEFDKRSLFIFSEDFIIRKIAIKIVESKHFEAAMMTIILLNSLSLALFDYSDRDSTTYYNEVIDYINVVFTIIFLSEAAIKVLAYGVIIHKNSYLRSGWNIIDAIVVFSGILELSIGAVKLKSLRIMRIFRPLKTINALPGMKKLITALISSIPDFANVVLFLVFVFLMFATIGLHQYNGTFYNACRYQPMPDASGTWSFDSTDQRLCSTTGLGNYKCPGNLTCGNPIDYPGYYLNHESMDSRGYINFGITNFDNIGTSLLTVFQIITSDTWYQQLCNLMDVDIPAFGAIFCILMIIVGQFFLLNLFLAVIVFSFIKSQAKEVKIEIQILKQEKDRLDYEKNSKANQLKGLTSCDDQPQRSRKSIFEDVKRRQKNPKRKELSQNDILASRSRTLGMVSDTMLAAITPGETPANVNQSKAISKDFKESDFATFLRPQIQRRKVANVLKGLHRETSFRAKLLLNGSQKKENEEMKLPENVPYIRERNMNNIVVQIEELDEPEQKSQSPSNQSKDSIFENNVFIEVPNARKNSQIVLESLNKERFSIIQADQLKVNQKNRKYSSKNKGGLQRVMSNSNSFESYNISSNNSNLQKHSSLIMKYVNNQNAEDDISSNLFQRLFTLSKIQSIQNIKDQTGIQSSKPPNIWSIKENDEGNENFDQRLESPPQQEAEDDSPKMEDQQATIQAAESIKKQIENEYETYFQNIIEEADEHLNSQKANMRELVGIKVGLEFIMQHDDMEKRIEQEKKDQKVRKRASKIIRHALKISLSSWFQWFIAVSISSNTLILSLDSYPENLEITNIVEKLNIVFAVIYAMELIIKIVAHGFRAFFKGAWFNSFDCLIVIASLIDIILSNLLLSKSGRFNGSLFTVLRGFRLLRVFKLAKKWKRFELLLETMGKSFKDIANFAVFMLLFIFLFTLLGLELFAYKAKINLETLEMDYENGQSPDFNFDNFLNSFSLVFILLTNDGTSAVYYNYYRACGAAASTIYFILLVLVGQKVIINLFVAILLENFDEGALKQKLHDLEEKEAGMDSSTKILSMKAKLIKARDRIMNVFMSKCRAKKQTKELSQQKAMAEDSLNFEIKVKKLEEEHKQDDNIEECDFQSGPVGNSLYLFSKDSHLRNKVFILVKNLYFELSILCVIVVSSITLALNSPLQDPESTLQQTLNIIDTLTTTIFIIEALLKIIAYGFVINGKQSYLRRIENVIDFSIIVFSVMSMTPLSDDFKTFKVFRILRIISRNEGLRIAVRALFRAIPNIANVTLIMILFLLIFGVILVSQFKGKFYSCTNSLTIWGDHTLSSKWDCLNSGGTWQNNIYTFDDVPNALITLFVMSTTAGWQDILLICITSTDIDYVGGSERSVFWSLFFIFFVIIGFFFFLNLFIGVVVSTFNTEKDKLGGNDLLTEKQREWIDLKLLVLRCAPIKKIKPPQNRISLFFFKVQSHPHFENFIFACIVINTIFLTMKWFDQDQIMIEVLEFINYSFTVVFVMEAAIKILGQGPPNYFNDGWNRFDFLIAVASLISIIVSAFTSLSVKGAITLIRSIRVLRILRLLKKGGRNLYMIFNTFVITLHQLVNIGSLLIIIIYMYSVLGMILFGQIMRNGIMNSYMNFENFINAFFTLFTVTTGDSWDSTQTSFVASKEELFDCIANPTYSDYVEAGENTIGCGSKIIAYAFFTSFTFIVNLIFLQLFIAVILQGYDDTQIQEARLFNNEMSQRFREVWATFDPNATTFIYLHQLRGFLKALKEPLGFDQQYLESKFLQDKFIAQLELPTYHGFTQYQFLDVLDALSFRLMVLDHIKSKHLRTVEKQCADSSTQHSPDQELELQIKDQLSKEVNKLIFQRKSQGIQVVKSIMLKEINKGHKKYVGVDKSGFTSSHHMAAEATVRRMREFLKLRRKEHFNIAEITEIRQKVLQRHGFNSTKVLGSFNRSLHYEPSDHGKGQQKTIHFKIQEEQAKYIKKENKRKKSRFFKSLSNSSINNQHEQQQIEENNEGDYSNASNEEIKLSSNIQQSISSISQDNDSIMAGIRR